MARYSLTEFRILPDGGWDNGSKFLGVLTVIFGCGGALGAFIALLLGTQSNEEALGYLKNPLWSWPFWNYDRIEETQRKT